MDERKLIAAIDWSCAPPAGDVVYAPILSPKAGQTCQALVLGSAFVGVKTHWYQERTTICVGRANGCNGCKDALKSTWRGYLGVLRIDDEKLWIAEFTPRSYGDVSTSLLDTKSIRGWSLALSRPGTSKYGKVRAAIRPPNYAERQINLPEAFDVRRSLLLVWQRVGKISASAPPAEEEEGRDEE